MKTIGMADFRRMNTEQLKEVMPLLVTFDGEPWAYFVDAKDIIVVSDLHIRVRNNLRAQEKRARIGMPQVEKIFYKPVETETASV